MTYINAVTALFSQVVNIPNREVFIDAEKSVVSVSERTRNRRRFLITAGTFFRLVSEIRGTKKDSWKRAIMAVLAKRSNFVVM
jgi:hypothetical protein